MHEEEEFGPLTTGRPMDFVVTQEIGIEEPTDPGDPDVSRVLPPRLRVHVLIRFEPGSPSPVVEVPPGSRPSKAAEWIIVIHRVNPPGGSRAPEIFGEKRQFRGLPQGSSYTTSVDSIGVFAPGTKYTISLWYAARDSISMPLNWIRVKSEPRTL